MIRVLLPQHIATLARTGREIELTMEGSITQRAILDRLERDFPMLRGTLRDHESHVRRPFIRFFACNRDLSHDSPDAILPEAVIAGREPFLIIGAMAGG